MSCTVTEERRWLDTGQGFNHHGELRFMQLRSQSALAPTATRARPNAGIYKALRATRQLDWDLDSRNRSHESRMLKSTTMSCHCSSSSLALTTLVADAHVHTPAGFSSNLHSHSAPPP